MEISFADSLTNDEKNLFWSEVQNYNSVYGIFFSPNQTNNNIKLRAFAALRNAEVLSTANHLASLMEVGVGIFFLFYFDEMHHCAISVFFSMCL